MLWLVAMVTEVCRIQNGQLDGLNALNSENVTAFVIELERRISGMLWSK